MEIKPERGEGKSPGKEKPARPGESWAGPETQVLQTLSCLHLTISGAGRVVFREEDRGRRYKNRNGQAGGRRRGTSVEAEQEEGTKLPAELLPAFES